MSTDYQNPNPSPTTSSTTFLTEIKTSVKELFDTNLHKSLPIILIIGYVLIAFRTGFDDFTKVLYFMVFVCFVCVISFFLLMIQTYRGMFISKMWWLCAGIYSFCKRISRRIHLLEIFLVFLDILILINIYCIFKFSQGLSLREIGHIVINL